MSAAQVTEEKRKTQVNATRNFIVLLTDCERKTCSEVHNKEGDDTQ